MQAWEQDQTALLDYKDWVEAMTETIENKKRSKYPPKPYYRAWWDEEVKETLMARKEACRAY